MRLNYNFAEINIGINSQISYQESESFYNFLNDFDKENDIEVELSIKEYEIVDINCKVFNNIFNKVYKKGDILYREFYLRNSKKPISCFVEKEIDRKYHCYVYKNKKMDYSTYDIFSMIGFEYLLNKKGAIILHSSQILYNGKTILFTAPSQTGKSTQADLWQKYKNAELINGDRSAIRKVEGIWKSYGLPYAGSSKVYKNIASPIGAIVILRQGNKNEIRRTSKIEAFKYIYSETTVNIWDEEFINRTSDIIENLINEIPVYMYYCLPHKSAVDKLNDVLEGDVYDTTTDNETFI